MHLWRLTFTKLQHTLHHLLHPIASVASSPTGSGRFLTLILQHLTMQDVVQSAFPHGVVDGGVSVAGRTEGTGRHCLPVCAYPALGCLSLLSHLTRCDMLLLHRKRKPWLGCCRRVSLYLPCPTSIPYYSIPLPHHYLYTEKAPAHLHAFHLLPLLTLCIASAYSTFAIPLNGTLACLLLDRTEMGGQEEERRQDRKVNKARHSFKREDKWFEGSALACTRCGLLH